MGFVRRHPIAAALSLAFLLVAGVLAASAIAVWRSAHRDEARRVQRADIILVLGAAQYAGTPSPVFQGRLDHARLLYRTRFSDQVLVLGAGQPGEETTEAEAGARYLRKHGLPREAVNASPLGGSTFESLQAAADYMRERALRSAFLVSDPWHNLRIRRMARDLGIEAYVSATWHSAARSQGTRFRGYLREMFAYIYYRAAGR